MGVGVSHFVLLFQNWIGSEAVKRKKKAGILPRPKIEITGVSHHLVDFRKRGGGGGGGEGGMRCVLLSPFVTCSEKTV